jgi:hypothetical protein
MPSYEDFVRDYWAPDRDQVLADMQAQQAPAAPPPSTYVAPTFWGGSAGSPRPDVAFNEQQAKEYDRFAQDYWAPDREQVLQSMRPRVFGGTAGPAQFGPQNIPGNVWGEAGNYGRSGGGQGGGSGDPNAFRDAWLGSGGRTVADLKAFVQAHPEFGATLGGSKGDKVYGPGGAFWADAVISAGTGGTGASWNTDTGGGGGASGGSSFGQAPNATPFEFDPFKAPDPFSFHAFEAPTGLTEENDPGYQARLALGQQGLERSAAARGTLLTGGTLKDLNQYAQDYASNEFQNVYNRDLQTYQTQYGQAAQDYNANYQNALNAYNTNFNTAFKPWDANYQAAYQSWMGNVNAANMGFQNNLASQGQRFNQLYNTAQLGLQGTNASSLAQQNYGNSLADIYGNYGTNAGNNITNAGNAQGASQIAQGNAYANMANQYGNLGLYASMYGNGNGNTGGGSNGGGNGSYLYNQRFNNGTY